MATEEQHKGRKTFAAAAMSGTAARIVAGNAQRVHLLLRNTGNVSVYLGRDATVTAANGMLLKTDETLTDENSTDAWWGITAGSAGDIRAMEVS